MNIIVIHHRADFDGIFCREIARHYFERFYPGEAEYIGWDYGDECPVVLSEAKLYMLDISIDALMNHPNLNWIDHHKTAMEKFGKKPGYQIDGVAACRLAWQYFEGLNSKEHGGIPTKQDFIDRKVDEPWAVQLAGEYDIWDKRNPDAELFQHGLRSEDLYSSSWDNMFDTDCGGKIVQRLLNQGRAIQYAKRNENKDIITSFGFTIQFEGFCLLACNHARYNSQLFAAALRPEHDGCLGFNWDGQKNEWRISLYTDKPGADLSPVAVKYGGGGHKGACGFRTKTLPFLPS